MASHPPTSRTREKPVREDELVAGEQLSLGPFQGCNTFSVSEARLVLEVLATHKRNSNLPIIENENITKMTDYLDMFARFQEGETATAIETLLNSRKEFENFEKSQLGTLCPVSADEAIALIPSLANKISQEDLTELLVEMTKIREANEPI